MATTKNHVSTYVDDGLLSSIDRLADAFGKSRSFTLNWVLSEFKDGMDRISACIEIVEPSKEASVAEFMTLISHAIYQMKDGSFELVGSPGFDNVDDD